MNFFSSFVAVFVEISKAFTVLIINLRLITLRSRWSNLSLVDVNQRKAVIIVFFFQCDWIWNIFTVKEKVKIWKQLTYMYFKVSYSSKERISCSFMICLPFMCHTCITEFANYHLVKCKSYFLNIWLVSANNCLFFCVNWLGNHFWKFYSLFSQIKLLIFFLMTFLWLIHWN